MYALSDVLKIPLPFAVGMLEMMWHFVGANTPRGDIGSAPDSEIAAAVGWPKKPALLLTALCANKSRWLDRDPEFRYIVHDWPDHADYEVCRKLIKTGKDFLPIYGKSAYGRAKSAEGSRELLGESAPHVKAKALALAVGSESERKKDAELLWLSAGFANPDDFEDWFLNLVSNHPNRNYNAQARMHLFELIVAGQFLRDEFDSGYAALRESKLDDWLKDGGKFATNLFEIVRNNLWKFTPVDASPAWVRELEQEQNR